MSTASIYHAEKVPILMAFMNCDGAIDFRLQRGRTMALIEALICHCRSSTCPENPTETAMIVVGLVDVLCMIDKQLE